MTAPKPEGDILYIRPMTFGPAVRIRRTSADSVSPVIAVLEVDRRYGTPREKEPGYPPPLAHAEGATDAEVLAVLEPIAKDDQTIVRLMREKGLR
jgi:hypothetical protein